MGAISATINGYAKRIARYSTVNMLKVMTTILNEPAVEQKQTTKPDFGKGRYSAEMERIYDALIERFEVEPKKAEKIAKQAGSDAGAVFRNAIAEIRISKTSKDGKATIADASKVKGVTMTNPLAIVRAIQWLDDAGKNFVSYGKTKWQFSSELTKWVAELEVKE